MLDEWKCSVEIWNMEMACLMPIGSLPSQIYLSLAEASLFIHLLP